MDAFMTLDEVATRLVEALQPLMAGGVISIVTVADGGRVPDAPYVLIPSGLDTRDAAATKLLQAVVSAYNLAGAFNIVSDLSATPRVTYTPTRFTPPKYHPPGERRYWEKQAIQNL